MRAFSFTRQVCDTEHLLDDLGSCNNSFNIIEKSLNAYLDSKKLLFPRCVYVCACAHCIIMYVCARYA